MNRKGDEKNKIFWCLCLDKDRNRNKEATKMAISRLTEKNDVAILLASVQNLWNSALAVQDEMVKCFIRYRRKHHWLIALTLGGHCNRAVKKSQCFENHENTGFAQVVKMIGGYILNITK